jgi:hypothetical protein
MDGQPDPNSFVTGALTKDATMIPEIATALVDFCARKSRLVIATSALLMITAAAYDIEHFSITTDVDALIDRKLPWHQRQLAFSQAFPQRGILAVVSAKTPENATLAANELAQRISKRSDLFRSVV